MPFRASWLGLAVFMVDVVVRSWFWGRAVWSEGSGGMVFAGVWLAVGGLVLTVSVGVW